MPQNLGAATLILGADRRLLLDMTRPLHSIRLLRAEKFDLFLDYSSWQRLTAFFTLMSGARFTAGFATQGMHRARGYDLTEQHRRDLHEVDNFRRLTRSLGLAASHAPAITMPVGQDLTQVWPAGFTRPVVLLHLWPSGTRSYLREWPLDRWLALAILLRERFPQAVFGITGTPAERPQTDAFLQQMEQAGLTAYPVLASFPQLAELLCRSSLVVSVNTGVMHLAAIAGAPTVSINGPNGNHRWGPAAEAPRAIGVDSPGEGCGFLHLGFDFDGKPSDCMERITVDQVNAAIDAVLAKGGSCRAGNA